MNFKKSTLATAIFTLLLAAPVYAETDGWGGVAGEPESSTLVPSEAVDVESVQLHADPNAWGAVEAVESSAPTKPTQAACGKDDPRYARIAPILNELKAGKSIEPLQTSFGTYSKLSNKIRTLLGNNLYISASDCSEQHFFDGELVGKVTVPFTELWQVMNDSLRTDDQAMLSFIVNNTRAAPESALSVISMVQFVHLSDEQLRKFYTVAAPGKAKQPELDKPLMLEIFLIFAGTVNESERGKTAFIKTYYDWIGQIKDDILEAIYLENNSGETQVSGLATTAGMVPIASSLLKATGLRPQVAGSKAEELAAK